MQFQGHNAYIAGPGLIDDVNAALLLGRPLLLKGEPGTGKTVLAARIAESLGMPLYEWNVKSTSKAQDGLYVYDTVQRLNDARFGEGDVRDIRRYIRMGPLGLALQSEQRVVLLIDEIDKADLEFPNDLLYELDRMRFRVTETGDEIEARVRPMVVVTSNSEKELPDAFLRRCVFHFLAFPDRDAMARIVRVHFPDLAEAMLTAALERFYAVREMNLRKKPATSELIDWLRILMHKGIEPGDLHGGIPNLGALLKTSPDLELALRQLQPPAG